MNYDMKILKIEDITRLPYDVLIEAVSNGFTLENTSEIYTLENTNLSTYADVGISSLASCPSSITQGTTHTITVGGSGGYPPYNFTFTVDGNGVWQGQAKDANPISFSHTFNEPLGNHTYAIQTTDSCTATSGPQLVSYACPPINIVSSATCTALSSCSLTCPSSVTQGNNALIGVSWSGGYGPYNVWIYDGGTLITSQGSISGTSVSLNIGTSGAAIGSHNISAQIGDNCPSKQQYCGTNTCTMNVTSPSTCPSPISSCTITCPSSATQGTNQTFSLNWSGGAPNYTVYLYLDSSGVAFTKGSTSSTSISLSTTVNWSVGTHYVHADIVDSCNTKYCTTSYCSLNVTSGTTCTSISPCNVSGPSSILPGQSATYNASWSGGNSPYGVQLMLDGVNISSQSGISGTSTSFTVPTGSWSVGSHKVYVNVWYQCSTDGTYKSCTGSNYVAVTVLDGQPAANGSTPSGTVVCVTQYKITATIIYGYSNGYYLIGNRSDGGPNIDVPYSWLTIGKC